MMQNPYPALLGTQQRQQIQEDANMQMQHNPQSQLWQEEGTAASALPLRPPFGGEATTTAGVQEHERFSNIRTKAASPSSFAATAPSFGPSSQPSALQAGGSDQQQHWLPQAAVRREVDWLSIGIEHFPAAFAALVAAGEFDENDTTNSVSHIHHNNDIINNRRRSTFPAAGDNIIQTNNNNNLLANNNAADEAEGNLHLNVHPNHQIDLLVQDPFEALWRRRQTLTAERDRQKQSLAITRHNEWLFEARVSKLRKLDTIRKAKRSAAVERKAMKVIQDLEKIEMAEKQQQLQQLKQKQQALGGGDAASSSSPASSSNGGSKKEASASPSLVITSEKSDAAIMMRNVEMKSRSDLQRRQMNDGLLIDAFPDKRHAHYAPREMGLHFPHTARRLRALKARLSVEAEHPLSEALAPLVVGEEEAQKKQRQLKQQSDILEDKEHKDESISNNANTTSNVTNKSFVGSLIAAITPNKLKWSSSQQQQQSTASSPAKLKNESPTVIRGDHEMHLPLDSLDNDSFHQKQQALKRSREAKKEALKNNNANNDSNSNNSWNQQHWNSDEGDSFTDAVVDFELSPPDTVHGNNEITSQQRVEGSGAYTTTGFHLKGTNARPPYPYLPSADAYASALRTWLFERRKALGKIMTADMNKEKALLLKAGELHLNNFDTVAVSGADAKKNNNNKSALAAGSGALSGITSSAASVVAATASKTLPQALTKGAQQLLPAQLTAATRIAYHHHHLTPFMRKRREVLKVTRETKAANAKKRRDEIAKELLSDKAEYQTDLKLARLRREEFLKAKKLAAKELRETHSASFKLRRAMMPTMRLLNSSVGQREIREEFHKARLENRANLKKKLDTKQQTAINGNGGGGFLANLFSGVTAVPDILPTIGLRRSRPMVDDSLEAADYFPKDAIIGKLIVPHTTHRSGAAPLNSNAANGDIHNSTTTGDSLKHSNSVSSSAASERGGQRQQLNDAASSSSSFLALTATGGFQGGCPLSSMQSSSATANITLGDTFVAVENQNGANAKVGNGLLAGAGRNPSFVGLKKNGTPSSVASSGKRSPASSSSAFRSGGRAMESHHDPYHREEEKAEALKEKIRQFAAEKAPVVPVKMRLRLHNHDLAHPASETVDNEPARENNMNLKNLNNIDPLPPLPAPSSANGTTTVALVELDMRPMTVKQMQSIITANVDRATRRRTELINYRKNRLAAFEVIRKKRTAANIKKRESLKPMQKQEREAFEADCIVSHRNVIELEQQRQWKDLVEEFEKLRLQ